MPASLILVSVRSRHERRDNKFVVATRGAKVPIALGAPQLANLGGGDDAAVYREMDVTHSAPTALIIGILVSSADLRATLVARGCVGF
jgi:hypothetical protein